MKKILAITLVLITFFAFSACSGNGIQNGENDTHDEKTSVFKTDSDMLGFSAVSSMKMLSANQMVVAQSMDAPFERLSLNVDDLQILKEIDELEQYLELINTFMGEGNGFSTVISENDSGDYDYTMTIATTDVTGDVIIYTFEYNETIEDVDEDEYDSVLNGIMVIGDVTYTFVAEREVESDGESLELLAMLDEENYVTLKYEIEYDTDEIETAFEYEVYIDKQLVRQVIIEFEQDNDETEMSLYSLEGTIEREYEFEIEYKDDEISIEIDYKFVDDGTTIEEGSIEITVWFDYDTNTFKIAYEIEIDGEETIRIERNYKDNDDDDDDDDDDDNGTI